MEVPNYTKDIIYLIDASCEIGAKAYPLFIGINILKWLIYT